MSLATIEFYSQSMGQHVTYNLWLPDQAEGPYPVLFQLHGLSDSCHTWIHRSNILRHVEPYPMAIAFPDGGTSCYVNWKSHDRIDKRRYEDLIVTDIPAHLKRHFNVTDGPWAIGGLSMGGYGSMRIGLKHADRFASIWSHSSKFLWEGMFEAEEVEDAQDCDVFHHADQVARRADKPVITFDCGVDDELLKESRALHTHMDAIGLEHNYEEHPGAHEWDYWDTWVQPALKQHAQALGIDRS